jgi:TPR repeat protein
LKRIFLLFCFCIVGFTFGQDSTKSFAFKNNQPPNRSGLFYQPDLSYRIWQQFNLIKEANAGDPLAQHELGIRYLLGEGVEADTVKAAEWIKSAADHGVTAAKYNYAILLINGWGTDWNPFRAFEFFREAAEEGMPQAQYALGLLYTDNLIVRRNWGKAYNWISKSAQKGNKDAGEILKEIRTKVPESKIDTSAANLISSDSTFDKMNSPSIKSSLGLVYIDFEDVLDTIPNVTNKRLLEDLTHSGNTALSDSIKNSLKDTNFVSISDFIPLIREAAEYGSPEALTFLGKLYETGIYYKKDLLTAIEYYIRASRLDSPTASILLYKMQKADRFFPFIKKESDSDNPVAQFDWYGLEILGLDNQITLKDALKLLERAADKNFIPALVEYGLYYYSLNLPEPNLQKAFSFWESAKNLGSKEAEIRMNAATILDQLSPSDNHSKIDQLLRASDNGSVLAQTTIAYAYENGLGLDKNKAEAAKYYRDSAQRGNRFAYDHLKALYDSIRPSNPEFEIN